MKRRMKADMGLMFITICWGASFLLVKNSVSSVPAYNFLAIRFLIAFLISSLVFGREMKKIKREELKYGIILGFILFLIQVLQTVGLEYTTVSKSAFITGFNVVLVPITYSIMERKTLDKKSYVSAVIAFVGLAMFTLNKGTEDINIGDIYTFISAVLITLYIILVGRYTIHVDSVVLAIIQIGTVGVLSTILSFILEKPAIPVGYSIWFNILTLSILCTSVAYIVQNVAQRYTSPTHAALITTAEPVFAAIFAYIVNGEVLSIIGICGAILIIVGMLISEIDLKELRVSK